jgi:glycosyltransferase involved in cell wall biosynthesis
MSDRLISVITIFLNPGRFFDDAIRSVLSQTYTNWELLLVDDGSSDGSTSTALEHASRDPGRIRYLEHSGRANRGTAASRNLGLTHARGDYIAFLDGDDVWLPHKLEQQVAIAEAHPDAAMVYGRTLYWYSWTGSPNDRERDFIPDLGVPPDSLVAPLTLLPLWLSRRIEAPCTCSTLVRRKVIDRLGGFDERFSSLYEDQAFYAKICLKEAVYVVGACWDRYRRHRGSTCSATSASDRRHWRHVFLHWLEEELERQPVNDREIRRVLQRELRPWRHPILYSLRTQASLLPAHSIRLARVLVRKASQLRA